MPPMDQKRFQKFAEKFPENLRALRGDSLPRSNSLHNGKGTKHIGLSAAAPQPTREIRRVRRRR